RAIVDAAWKAHVAGARPESLPVFPVRRGIQVVGGRGGTADNLVRIRSGLWVQLDGRGPAQVSGRGARDGSRDRLPAQGAEHAWSAVSDVLVGTEVRVEPG